MVTVSVQVSIWPPPVTSESVLEDALFSLKEAAVGFVADVGVLQRIPLIVGQGHARELAYTARSITAQRAKEIQLVNDSISRHRNTHGKSRRTGP